VTDDVLTGKTEAPSWQSSDNIEDYINGINVKRLV
jgi:hypothetical protein